MWIVGCSGEVSVGKTKPLALINEREGHEEQRHTLCSWDGCTTPAAMPLSLALPSQVLVLMMVVVLVVLARA